MRRIAPPGMSAALPTSFPFGESDTLQSDGLVELIMTYQMHTDSHRYRWNSGRIGRYRKLRPVGRLYSFIRVHLRSSVVRIRGLGSVAILPRAVHPRDSRETIRGCSHSSQDRNRQIEDGASIATAGRVAGADDRIFPVPGSRRHETPAAEVQTSAPVSSATAPA